MLPRKSKAIVMGTTDFRHFLIQTASFPFHLSSPQFPPFLLSIQVSKQDATNSSVLLSGLLLTSSGFQTLLPLCLPSPQLSLC